jgi:hypothetical protein
MRRRVTNIAPYPHTTEREREAAYAAHVRISIERGESLPLPPSPRRRTNLIALLAIRLIQLFFICFAIACVLAMFHAI